MSHLDRLSQIRDIVGAPRTTGNRPPDAFGFSKNIDTYSCYKDTQQHRFSPIRFRHFVIWLGLIGSSCWKYSSPVKNCQ